MAALQKKISNYQDETQEYEEAIGDALNAKTDFSITTIGKLMDNLSNGIDDLVKVNVDKDYYDKDLCSALKDTVTKLVTAFSKVKPPTITVSSPNISVDLSPLQSIAKDISTQNKSLISLIDKMSSGNKSEELYKLVVAMIGKQNTFLETALKQIDYTNQFNQIIAAIQDSKSNVEKIDIVRNGFGVLESIKPIYKTNDK